MALLRLASLLFCSLMIQASVAAQQPSQRDPQAVALLQRTLAAMGGTVPSDSVATGKLVLVEGSKTSNGTMRILTRGTDQSSEQMQLSDGNRSVVYSREQASEAAGTVPRVRIR